MALIEGEYSHEQGIGPEDIEQMGKPTRVLKDLRKKRNRRNLLRSRLSPNNSAHLGKWEIERAAR
jgi:hypothetical protein